MLSPETHRNADRGDQRDGRHCGHARRQHIPYKHVFDHVDGVGGRRDPAGQHARQPAGKIARRVTGKVAKQVAAHVSGHCDERGVRDPTRHAPQQIVGGDQRHKKSESEPDAAARRRSQAVNEEFDAILGPHRTRDRCNHRAKDDGVRNLVLPQIAGHEGERAIGISAKLDHAGSAPFVLATRISLFFLGCTWRRHRRNTCRHKKTRRH